MDEVELSTVIYLPPEEVYDFLIDFPRYANYSEYLTDVRQHGDGSPGTQYDLRLAWWKLTYTARSEVTGVDRPTKIDWKLIKDLDAHGHWRIEEVPEEAPKSAETASRVWLRVDFDPESARGSAIDLPRFVSFGWVIGKLKPKVVREAERVVRRIVTDLEGKPREIELEIHRTPDSV